MPGLISLRPGPRSWELDACPHTYSEAGKEQFKAMPGVRWAPDPTCPNRRGCWRGDRAAIRIVCRTLEAAGIAKVREVPLGSPTPMPLHLAYSELREYQNVGAGWVGGMLQESGAALLADEMGIGKSAQAIAALDALDLAGDRLVVCPAIVRGHWKNQIAQWGSTLPSWEIESYEGFQKRFKKAPGELEAFRHVVLDEGHYLANSKSKRSAAIASWLFSLPHRPNVVMLTGTPLQSRPSDLWHLLDVLWPGRFGSFWLFTKRYCGGRYEEIPNTERSVWVFDGMSRPLELAERLRDCMLRRTKADVALELPARTRQILEVALPARARKDLQRAQAAIDWTGRRSDSVQSLLSNVEEYKIDAATELAREIVAGGGRVLLLTTRKATAAALGQRLNAPVVDGDTPADERRAVIADAPIGIATMYSVTTGIDLVGFDSVVFVGLDWTPSTLLQAEARVHRIGQTRAVGIWYLVGIGTLDEVVKDRVIGKLDTFEAIAGASSDGLREDLRGGTDDEILAGLVDQIMGKAA
jgi:SWI/SNF-related matrix-associated actin-dependent regulator 1 of chromatin subfamily A